MITITEFKVSFESLDPQHATTTSHPEQWNHFQTQSGDLIGGWAAEDAAGLQMQHLPHNL